jgi:uncharacterized protein (TIGR04141 family)
MKGGQSRLYVLSNGDWFEIERNFALSVRNRVATIPSLTLSLPEARLNETEGQYNQRAASTLPLALMDRQIIRLGDYRDQIELCDLLSQNGQFIHVKRKTRSATLSHLFSQGVISAELFLWEQSFRDSCAEKLIRIEPSFASLIPSSKPETSNYEVAYAIIAKPNPNWPRSLPFFSQLNLYNSAERLQRRGGRVCLDN